MQEWSQGKGEQAQRSRISATIPPFTHQENNLITGKRGRGGGGEREKGNKKYGRVEKHSMRTHPICLACGTRNQPGS